jgi:dihydroxyacetone kinase
LLSLFLLVVGRRGLAGTVLAYKLAGALAEQGASVDEVYDVAHFVSENTASIGVGLEHCHLPGSSLSEEHGLGPDEMELCVIKLFVAQSSPHR